MAGRAHRDGAQQPALFESAEGQERALIDQLIAATRLYSSPTAEKPMTPDEEKAQVEKVWKESYKGLEKVPVVIDTDAMVRYGASATPTFALVDRKGVVRLYAPTRLSEAELSRRIEEVLAEAP